jgi:hypothetical protein
MKSGQHLAGKLKLVIARVNLNIVPTQIYDEWPGAGTAALRAIEARVYRAGNYG